MTICKNSRWKSIATAAFLRPMVSHAQCRHLLLSLLLIGAGVLLMSFGPKTYSTEVQAAGLAPWRAPIPAGCSELIVNGDFETQGPGWTVMASDRPPIYTPEQAFAGLNSMRLGITTLSNVESDSLIEQTVTLPTTADSIVLSFHYFPTFDTGPDSNDLQFVDVYNAFTNQFIARPLEAQRNDRAWLLVQYDLAAQAGQQIKLYFRVFNDGLNARAAMYVDNVSILACNATPVTATPTVNTVTPTATGPAATLTATPTPSLVVPTATSTPVPTAYIGCTNSLINGDFESNGFWIFGQDPIPPRYTGVLIHNGMRSVLQGNLPELALQNLLSYSSIRQLVNIPANATTAQLRWWQYAGSEEPPTENPTRFQDRQEVILLDPALKTIAVLRRVRHHDVGWQEGVLDLTPYLGKSFYIYFNVYNDGAGGRTWMYLDDVILDICYPPATPTPVPLPTATPTATETATVFVAATLTPTVAFIPPVMTETATVAAAAVGEPPVIDFVATATANALATDFAVIQTVTAQAASIAADTEAAPTASSETTTESSLLQFSFRDNLLQAVTYAISVVAIIIALSALAWSIYNRIQNGIR